MTSLFDEASRELVFDGTHLRWIYAHTGRGQNHGALDIVQTHQNAAKYIKFWLNGRQVSHSRAMFVLSKGKDISPGLVINHIDHNPANDAPSNLREGTYSMNRLHSAAKDVYFCKSKRTWRAQVRYRGLTHYGRHRATREEAESDQKEFFDKCWALAEKDMSKMVLPLDERAR